MIREPAGDAVNVLKDWKNIPRYVTHAFPC
jgi:hypothetical protein